MWLRGASLICWFRLCTRRDVWCGAGTTRRYSTLALRAGATPETVLGCTADRHVRHLRGAPCVIAAWTTPGKSLPSLFDGTPVCFMCSKCGGTTHTRLKCPPAASLPMHPPSRRSIGAAAVPRSPCHLDYIVGSRVIAGMDEWLEFAQRMGWVAYSERYVSW